MRGTANGLPQRIAQIFAYVHALARDHELGGTAIARTRDLNRRLDGRTSGCAWPAANSPFQPFGLAAPPDTKSSLQLHTKTPASQATQKELSSLTPIYPMSPRGLLRHHSSDCPRQRPSVGGYASRSADPTPAARAHLRFDYSWSFESGLLSCSFVSGEARFRVRPACRARQGAADAARRARRSLKTTRDAAAADRRRRFDMHVGFRGRA